MKYAPFFLYFDKYLGESNAAGQRPTADILCAYILAQLVIERLPNQYTPRHLAITAPAGSGKSTFVLQILIPYLVNMGYTVLFAVPYIAQVRQSEGKGGDTTLIYTSENKQGKNAETAYPAVMCTYDKAALAAKQLNKTGYSKGLILIIDEAQFLTLGQSYRSKALAQIEGLSKAQSTVLTIFLTATQSTPLIAQLQAPEIRCERAKQPAFTFAPLRTKAGHKGLAVLQTIEQNAKAGYKTFVYVNNTTEAKTLSLLLQNKGYSKDSIEIYRGDKINTQAANIQFVQTNECFPDAVQVAIATEVLVQAVNIKNDKFRLVYVVDKPTDKDGARLYQFVNRLREIIDKAGEIHCTVVFSETTWDGSETPKLGKTGRELNAVTYAKSLAWKLKSEIAQRKANKAESIESFLHYDLKISAPLQRRIKIFGGNMPSVFGIAYVAENTYFEHVTFEQFCKDVTQHTGKATVQFSEISHFEGDAAGAKLYKAAKEAVGADKAAAKAEILRNWQAAPQSVLGWYKAHGKDVLEAAKLESNETDYTPDSDTYHYANLAQLAAQVYNTTKNHKTVEIALERETLPSEVKKETAFKGLKSISKGYRYAVYIHVLQAMREAEISPLTYDAISLKNSGMQTTLSILKWIKEGVLNIIAESTAGERAEIDSKIKALREKKKNDKSRNAAYYTKAIKSLQYEKSKLAQQAAPVLFSATDLFKELNKRGKHYMQNEGYKETELSYILRGFTNCDTVGAKFLIAGNFDYTVEKYEAETAQQGAIKKRVLDSLETANKSTANATINSAMAGEINNESIDMLSEITSDVDTAIIESDAMQGHETETTPNAQQPTPTAPQTAPEPMPGPNAIPTPEHAAFLGRMANNPPDAA